LKKINKENTKRNPAIRRDKVERTKRQAKYSSFQYKSYQPIINNNKRKRVRKDPIVKA